MPANDGSNSGVQNIITVIKIRCFLGRYDNSVVLPDLKNVNKLEFVEWEIEVSLN